MAKVTVTVCDQCGTQENVRHYEIKEGTRRAALDLCDTHSVPLDQLLEEQAQAPQKATKRRTRTPRVTTMEEIEALKKK